MKPLANDSENPPDCPDSPDSVDPRAADDVPRVDPLPPPRFSMRHLLVAVTVCGVLLALMKAVGGYAMLLLLTLALAVAAHIAGNWIGTRLRDHSRIAAAEPSVPPPPAAPLSERDFAPATNLSKRQHLGLGLWVAIVFGAVAGGLAGLLLFASTDVEKATWQDTLLGAVSFAALGAMGAFVLASFAQVLLRAVKQAHDEDSRA